MSVLEDEIAAIDGVRGAQVETIDGAPVSVRLDLVEGVDPAEVAGMVQAVLRRHGLRSRRAGSPDVDEVGAGPTADADDADEVDGAGDDGQGDELPADEGESESPGEFDAEAAAHPSTPPVAPTPPADGSGDPTPPPTSQAPIGPVAAVLVRQTRTVTEVTVEAGGMAASRRCTAHPDEVHRAVAACVADLLGAVAPRVVEVAAQDVGGRSAVTVVLDTGHQDLAVGTSFVAGAEALAVARAVWAALVG